MQVKLSRHRANESGRHFFQAPARLCRPASRSLVAASQGSTWPTRLQSQARQADGVCVRQRESERAGSRTREHTPSLLSSPPHTRSHTHVLAQLHTGLGPTPQPAVLSFVQLGRLSRGGQAPHGPCHKARVTSDTIRVALTLIQSDWLLWVWPGGQAGVSTMAPQSWPRSGAPGRPLSTGPFSSAPQCIRPFLSPVASDGGRSSSFPVRPSDEDQCRWGDFHPAENGGRKGERGWAERGAEGKGRSAEMGRWACRGEHGGQCTLRERQEGSMGSEGRVRGRGVGTPRPHGAWRSAGDWTPSESCSRKWGRAKRGSFLGLQPWCRPWAPSGLLSPE